MKNLSFVCSLAVSLLILSSSGLHAKSPVSLKDLKKIQNKVEAVAKKTLPATVSLFSAKNGASGSGVIVSETGLILTAGHVVRGTDEMTVIFPNGKETQGKVLGANFTRDSAMIQIVDNKTKWPYAEIGNSENLEVGNLVIALGHAGGYDAVRTPPVRFGRVIARGENDFITTDCALIGGDSGGPLFDLEGRVIGIHSSIGEQLASNNHASIEGYRTDWDRLKDGKTWGRLGGNRLDDPDTPILGVITGDSVREGMILQAVVEGGPAAQAGIRAGDILTSINGRAVSNLRSLHKEIANHKAGNVVLVGILREGERLTRKVELGRIGDFK